MIKFYRFMTLFRAVGRFENSEKTVLFGGHNMLHLVEIELTDLPKSEGAISITQDLMRLHANVRS